MDKSYPITPVVERIGKMHIEGNIIPHSWYQARVLQFANGKPNLVAIILLSDLLYWYRPTVTRDEATGRVVSVRRKFHADKLHKDYAQWGNQFGFTLRQVEDATAFLKRCGLVAIERRAVQTAYRLIPNCAFIEPVPEAIEAISFPSPVETGEDNLSPVSTGNTPHQNGRPSPVETGDTPRQDGIYTKTPTETPTKNSQRKQKQHALPEPLQEAQPFPVVGDDSDCSEEDKIYEDAPVLAQVASSTLLNPEAVSKDHPTPQELLLAELVSEGMGHAQARKAVEEQYDMAVMQLENLRRALPDESLRPASRGAWLNVAIRDGYGPTKGYTKYLGAQKAQAERQAAQERREAAAQARREAERVDLEPTDITPEEETVLRQRARNCVHPDWREMGEQKCARMIRQNYGKLLRGEEITEHCVWAVPKTVNKPNDVCGGSEGQMDT